MLLSEAWKKYQQDKKIEGYSPLTLKNSVIVHGKGDKEREVYLILVVPFGQKGI